MARKHSLTELTAVNSEDLQQDTTVTDELGARAARKAIGAVSRSFQQLKSQGVLEIDPELIDPPLIKDRLEIEGPKLDGLIEQMREQGQQVPILVRPNATDPQRYQIAYGWRRTAAARALGIKVRATVKDLSDAELVVAQGQENSEREDLSFIEKALYASNLEEGGFSRDIIMAALAVDKTTCSRLISTIRRIPKDLVEAIGPAPKTGRDRWVELAAKIKDHKGNLQVLELIGASSFLKKDSDDRFEFIFKKLATKMSRPSAAKSNKPIAIGEVGSMTMGRAGISIKLSKDHQAGFSQFLEREMSQLLERYLKSIKDG